METARLLDQQHTPLTRGEEELYDRIVARLKAYFHEFEEIEGFSVLGTNLHRLFRKVALELRCVCYEYHDTYLLIEALRAESAQHQEDLERQRELSDQVIVKTEALLHQFQRMKADHNREIARIQEIAASSERMLNQQAAAELEMQLQQQFETLTCENEKRIELLQVEHNNQLQVAKTQAEAKKNADLEYIEVQLRMQITSQVSRELGRKLAAQEKACAKHLAELRNLKKSVTSTAKKRMQPGGNRA